MNPYAIIGALVAAILIGSGGFFFGDEYGTNKVQAKWDADTAARAMAEKTAVLARVSENQGIFRQQEITNQNITKVHNDELAKVRADLSRSERLRIGTALCPRSASQADTPSAGSSDAANPGAGLVSESTQRSIDALIMQVEEALATGRACQAFVTKNGMAP